MDHGVKTDIWSVMEDFSKAPGGQDFSKLQSQYALFGLKAGVSVCVSHEIMHYCVNRN